LKKQRVFILLSALLAAPAMPAAPPEPAVRILFIGNSLTYFNDLPGIVAALVVAAGKPAPVCKSVVQGGYSLEDHWIKGDALKAIEAGRWDFVVLQQGPSSSDDGRDVLRQYSRRFLPAIRKAGATAALYMVWPSATDPRLFGAVSDTYRLAAKDVGGVFVPAGEAWRIARRTAPEVTLYTTDGFHPTAAGSYLAALVFVGELFGASPEGLPSTLRLESGEALVVAPEGAKALQKAAAEAIKTYR
jgi:hypothetical protein